jgi:hypothetical protein
VDYKNIKKDTIKSAELQELFHWIENIFSLYFFVKKASKNLEAFN